jgi:hypothetical protein
MTEAQRTSPLGDSQLCQRRPTGILPAGTPLKGRWRGFHSVRVNDQWRVIFRMNHRRMPTTPGEILRQEFLEPLGMTQKQLADHIGCDVRPIF